MKKRIVMVGSYVADLTGVAEHLPKAAETVFGEQFKIGPGGKGSNQAVAAHKAGADITLVTKIGDDVFGKLATDFYKDLGINTEHIILDKENGTGVALICVDAQTKQNQILVVPNACARFTDGDIEELIPLIKSADILLVQFEINMDALEKIISAAEEAGVFIILNPAPAQEADREMLSKVDLITPNEIEAGAITGVDVTDERSALEAATIFHEWGIPQVVITMGSLGAFVSADGKSRMIPAVPVKAVDTTGAGDAFNGGLATAISEGMDLFKAAEFGAALASLSVQKFGTAPSMPERSEIDRIFFAE